MPRAPPVLSRARISRGIVRRGMVSSYYDGYVLTMKGRILSRAACSCSEPKG